MAVAEGSCPSCGAPMTFGVGASISQICKFCKAVVVRGDRGLENIGIVADIAATPCPIAVGDEATLEGKRIRVLGRVQLDHGEGPWDEWYILYESGNWAWLSYAQGNWYVTKQLEAPPKVPSWDDLALEQDIFIGDTYRVVEKKRGTVVSGEGELPAPIAPNDVRYYADLSGHGFGFGTINYGNDAGGPTVSVGRQLPESALVVTKPAGDRPIAAIGTDAIICPSCGATIPALAPNRAARLACPYCNVVSDIATRTVLETQQNARQSSDIPLGSRGSLRGHDYVVCGYVERSAVIEGERFAWQEYLLFGAGMGFRWLVKDEASWMWVEPVCAADVRFDATSDRVFYNGQRFKLRNADVAVVDHVVGEFYWRVRVGESVEARDFIKGTDVLSREATSSEVLWSFSDVIDWATIAGAFGLEQRSPGAVFAPVASGDGGVATKTPLWIYVLVAVIILFLVVYGDCGSGGGFGVFSGGGIRGGK